jgi:hypothetical protein
MRRVFEFHRKNISTHAVYHVRNNLSLSFRPTKRPRGIPFVWSSIVDDNAGGAVVANILESLKIVVPEKNEKVLPYKSQYLHWWLLLVDRIGWGLDAEDIDQIRQAYDIPTYFEQIVLLDPNTLGVRLLNIPFSLRL